MYDLSELAHTANLIRQDIIKMLYESGSGHAAGALGMADIISALYFYLLKHDPKNPHWPARDRLILSNGHICPVLYAGLARAGYFDPEKLLTLRKINSPLQGHPNLGLLPGIENSSGPLGQGISMAVGLALSCQIEQKNFYTICLTSDGEQNEGQTWEAYMLACKYKLDHLIFILDRNNIQIDGYCDQIMPLEPLKSKFEAFGLLTFEIDGHNFEEFIDVYLKAKTVVNKPVMIIAHTIPGKGVSFMQNLPLWHGKAPNKEETEKALKELDL
jgi:transketolase